MQISLIIPTYNEKKIIAATLQQFQSMRGNDFEIIVSDNGSTDRTVTLARPLADKVIPLPLDVRTSIGECRNRGARVATGDLLWFIDADVRVPRLKDLRHSIVDRFSSDQTIVAATVPLQIYGEERTTTDRLGFGLVNFLTYAQNRILKTGGAPGDCQIVRRSSFEHAQGYNQRLHTSEDHDLFHRLSKFGSIIVCKKFHVELSGRRIHSVGWPSILWTWGMHWVHDMILHQPLAKQWEARR